MLVSCLLTLATCAWSGLASQQQIPLPNTHQQPAVDAQNSRKSSNNKNGTTISSELFAELEELARVVDITYCVGSVGAGIEPPFTCPSRCGDFPSFELVTAFSTGYTMSDSCGFVALSHSPAPKRVILAYRGTYSLADTIADLSTIPQEYVPYPGTNDSAHNGSPGGGSGSGNDHAPKPVPKCENCTVHTGFYTSWMNTREIVLPLVLKAVEQYPDYAVTIVGHSLGGAVAAFAGLELIARGLHPTVTTFGEPRVGNANMAQYLDARFNLTNRDSDPNHRAYRRVTHVGDPVPLLPLDEWGYEPHGGEIFISKWELPPEVDDIRHCEGRADATCVAEPEKGFWAIPARFKLWQLFFAHRDYFWRLGLCIPTMDGWWPGVGKEVEL